MNKGRESKFLFLKKALSFSLFALTLMATFLTFDVTKAAGDVTLIGSPFSDPDAEDAHLASQWVVRDSGSTVFDSGTDATNLTTITISGATFTNGTTYFWKVKYQDQHLNWSAYSDESSFVYNDGVPTPTPVPPTGTPTGTPIITPTGTSTSTSTPTSTTTSTSTSTATSTSTSTFTPTATTTNIECTFGKGDIDGDGVEECLPDPYIGEIIVNKPTDPCLATTLSISYLIDDDDLIIHRGQRFNKPYNYKHDIYLSTDLGLNYSRIIKDFDYTKNSSWVDVPGKNFKYLKVNSSYNIPNDLTLVSSNTKILVHAYNNSFGQDLGNSFIAPNGEPPIGSFSITGSSDSFKIKNDETCKYIPTITPTSTATQIPAQCLMDINKPVRNTSWKSNEQYELAWTNKSENISKINVVLSDDKGKTFSYPLTLERVNSGSALFEVEESQINSTSQLCIKEVSMDGSTSTSNRRCFKDSRINSALRIEGYDRSGSLVSRCDTAAFTISMRGGGSGPTTPEQKMNLALALGTLIATIGSSILSAVSSIPALARGLFRIISALFSPPVWPEGKPEWGKVYDAVSKKPLEGVILRIFTEPDQRLKETQKSNKLGNFGFLVPVGKYSITASKLGFSFPSNFIVGKTDGSFKDLYKGGQFVIEHSETDQKAPIHINIPMDHSSETLLDQTVIKLLRQITRFFEIIRFPLMIIGTFASVWVMFSFSRWYDYLIVLIYAILWILELRVLFKKKTYGIVRDEANTSIPLALVRVTDKNNKIVSTLVTGDDGRFVLNLNPGFYVFQVSKPGFIQTRSDSVRINKAEDLGRLNLTLKKIPEDQGSAIKSHEPEEQTIKSDENTVQKEDRDIDDILPKLKEQIMPVLKSEIDEKTEHSGTIEFNTDEVNYPKQDQHSVS